ncbi:TadE/TadG family type IV pilus assembly protein [Rhizobium sp. Root1220]|uniref:TadE/TadG family type IV pilus assembly protein n=1 Tax=Rhizobium sp. Root1220 TaxID=1736432 RepID=UPI0006F6D4FE|nr:TadE/TadG family type IV pilus assembly protein [Rhizobium sp. Root1220]KQV80013.1 hypothetical protein ASC90_25770 [Rhizobium sp. Root1220]
MNRIRKAIEATGRRARQLVARDDGVAGVEMALVTPVLLLLLCGGGEVALYARSNFQAAQTASTVADAVSRYEAVTSVDISSIFTVSGEIMGGRDFSKNGYVILSSISRTSGAAPKVAWQCKGGTPTNASRVGLVSKAATLPNSLVLDATDNVIVAEVFYQYTPIFDGFVPLNELIYKTAVFRPRLGDLTSAPGC